MSIVTKLAFRLVDNYCSPDSALKSARANLMLILLQNMVSSTVLGQSGPLIEQISTKKAPILPDRSQVQKCASSHPIFTSENFQRPRRWTGIDPHYSCGKKYMCLFSYRVSLVCKLIRTLIMSNYSKLLFVQMEKIFKNAVTFACAYLSGCMRLSG